jgi:predicted phosphoribosyltransferase
MFSDRIDAGFALAEKLKKYSGMDGVILAVPKGGIPVGYIVAKRTGLPLDLLLTKKIGHPQNREYAIGAVSLTDIFLLPHKGVSWAYIKAETEQIRTRLREMRLKFMGTIQPLPMKDKTVIIIDDGVATGNTLLNTINMIRKEAPARIVIAVPVASAGAAQKLSELADEFISLLVPEEFNGVGEFYADFHQVTDDEVLYYLNELREASILPKEAAIKTFDYGKAN